MDLTILRKQLYKMELVILKHSNSTMPLSFLIMKSKMQVNLAQEYRKTKRF
jgi:hypothetical protein